MTIGEYIAAAALIAFFYFFFSKMAKDYFMRNDNPPRPSSKFYSSGMNHTWGTTNLEPGDLTRLEEKLGTARPKKEDHD